MSDIHLEIRRTESAIAGAIGARTRLGKLPPSPEHRVLMAKLESVMKQLEVELARLRYAARHSEARA